MRQPVPFGKYLLLDRISVGGMAEVFKAKSYGVEGFEKIIAIKRILPTMGEDRDFIKMFIDEAKIAGQLAHANICQIFELGRIDGSHFIAMEYIWGKDLLQIQNRVRKQKQVMPVPMACFVIAKVLEGLDYAHRKRDPLGRPLEIVHRDCSPQNVLVSYEGEVKVIDFGIAKATSRNSRTMAGVLKGKFGYMSPEQVRGLPLDRRSDIFALGTMLYECLTGERLFQGETDFSTLEKVRNVDIRNPRDLNPNIPEAIERVILKALAKDVDDRYQWCSEMLADLQQYLMGQDVVFTAKSLSGWLKEVFAGEIDKERQLLEQYKRVGRDGLIAGVPSAEAKLDVVEHLGEAGQPEGDATMLGSPSFDDLEQAVAANAAPEMGAKSGKRASSQASRDDDGDFGEEAPTEIFGELDGQAQGQGKPGAITTPPPLAPVPSAGRTPAPALAASAAPSRPPKPPPGRAPTAGQPPLAAPLAASSMPGVGAGALPSPIQPSARAAAALASAVDGPVVSMPAPQGSSPQHPVAGPQSGTRPAAMPLNIDLGVPTASPSARTMGPGSVVPGYAPAQSTPDQGYGAQQGYGGGGGGYYAAQQGGAPSAPMHVPAGTPTTMPTQSPSQPLNAVAPPGGNASGKTMMGGMTAPVGNYGAQYRVSGQQAAVYPPGQGYPSGPQYVQSPYSSGQMPAQYGNQSGGYQVPGAPALEQQPMPVEGKKKSSIGRDVAIGVAIAALVLGGFLAVKFLVLDSGSSGGGDGSASTSSIATIRLALPTGVSADLFVDDKKIATVSDNQEIPVTAGERKVKLVGPNGAKCEQALKLAAGKTTPLECPMKVEAPATNTTGSGSAAGASTGTTAGSAAVAATTPAETKPAETSTTTTTTTTAKPAETSSKPSAAETKPAETSSKPSAAETKVAETKPAETKGTATVTKPAETKTTTTTTKPAETKTTTTTTKPAETKTTTTTKPAETKPAATDVDKDKGYLAVQSTPSAKILVDGVDTGMMTPISAKQLPLAPGKHKITFVIGADKFTFAVMIKAGQTEVLKKDLQ
ncbi:MAG: protein kinase [Myxococcales bacterium]|nr:protein kinase [Myxococcales bacterium]